MIVQAVAYILLGLGLSLLALGFALGGFSLMKEVSAPVALGSAGIALTAWLTQKVHDTRQALTFRKAQGKESELAIALTPQLFGNYNPYIIEAAEKLGQARDTSAVPALLRALEECVDSQRPGWKEVGETLTNALSRIGDSRALPLLYRLESVRGIGFIPSIRNAIASIEPHSSLLRAGSADNALDNVVLLRPVQHSHEEEAPLLLRAAEGETR